jgi:hypothetical protein
MAIRPNPASTTADNAPSGFDCGLTKRQSVTRVHGQVDRAHRARIAGSERRHPCWTKRFVEKINGKQYPTMNQAGNYGGMLHFLKAVEAAQTHDGAKIVAKMKELPTDDVTFGKGRVREDGRHMHPMYLWEVKKPEGAWRPLDQGDCKLASTH